MTNDGHPITHESTGFGITTTWPHPGLTGLRYRVRVYPPFTSVRPPSWRGPRLCQDRSRGKNAITAKLSYRLPLTFRTESMNIYESILILHLHPPPSFCFVLKRHHKTCGFFLNPAAAARIIGIIHPNDRFPFFNHMCTFDKRSQSSKGSVWSVFTVYGYLNTETSAWPSYIWFYSVFL